MSTSNPCDSSASTRTRIEVIEYCDGEVGQQLSLCFEAICLGGTVGPSSESTEVRFVPLAELESLSTHPSTRLQIQHVLTERGSTYSG